MEKRNNILIDPRDLAAALGLLTRLPVPIETTRAVARGAAAAWAYPVVGIVVAVIISATVAVMLTLDLPAQIAAALGLGAGVVLTGAMHEDGLADTADGLWGGWDRARRLAIMKDSHIGTYGVIALALTLLIRWLALTALIASGSHWAALIGAAALSRGGMVVLMGAMPNARDTGLSHHVGRPSTATIWLAVAIAGVIGLVTTGFGVVLMAALAVLLCGMIAKAKIGGQTGDILGATQQMTEITVLLAVVAASA
ncbi:adenosylcobinamide-GDP ribazoletransferase [Yoonia sp.]|uniref:adenosylcobinamide-GDP ribazoletransferase n=1 Tax=Yoonia sp. TaxID=2212373 RepID=UPI002600485C|nr:adenosylcobinamide-GDP ribazoletransferase [Yoonia sp.]